MTTLFCFLFGIIGLPGAQASGSSDFQARCSAPGVIKCFGFDNDSELFYGWPGRNDYTNSSVCDNDPYLKTKTWYPISGNKSGPGNVYATIQNSQCIYPAIDNSNTHSGAGSLKFTIPSNSGANSSGYFTEVFQRLSNGTFGYIAPGSPLGNVVYFQFYQRFDSNFQGIDYQCIGGSCGGWKQAIYYGNPPNGSSSSLIEVTHNNGWQRGVPQMYGQQGHDDYGIEDTVGCTYAKATSQGGPGSGFISRPNYLAPLNPTCAHYTANQWMEFTVRVEVNGARNSDSPSSRVQMWVDGELVVDYPMAKIDWGSADGDGLGQIMLTPYHTNKDSSQTHPVGYTWYDDLIISTQPIAMSTGTPTPPAAPIGLRIR